MFEGRVTLASREDLRDTLAPVPETVARVRRLQAGVAGSGPDDAGWVGDLVARCAAAGETASDAEAARVLRAVVRVEVRDGALYAVTRESAASHLHVWADLLRRAPESQVPDTAAVVAFCAWQAGDGALAWCALDRCFDVDPDHRLGPLPGRVPHAGGASRRVARSGGRAPRATPLGMTREDDT